MAYYGGIANEKPTSRIDQKTMTLVGGIIILWLGITAALLFREPAPPAQGLVAGSPVLVASVHIGRGERLDPSSIRQAPWDGSGAFGAPLTSLEFGKLTYATEDIEPNTQITTQMVRVMVPSSQITAKIPAGYRAVTISVDAESGVEGWVRPQTRVDVIWTTMHQSRPAVTTIVQSAEVLSAEQSMTQVTDIKATAVKLPSHVTLLVSNKDAQKIQLAKSSGSLSLILRGDEDITVTSNEMVFASTLLKASGIDAPGEKQGTLRFGKNEFEVVGGKLVNISEAQTKEAVVP